MRTFGLIGRNIIHSFSKIYFTEKFQREAIIDATYELFDLVNINLLQEIFDQKPRLYGLNVTIPYKETVIPLLTDLTPEASQIGAVNTIKITEHKRIGYNTDAYGFERSFTKHLKSHHRKALILGTGGAAKSIMFALEKLGIPYRCVSRKETPITLTYTQLTSDILETHEIIINCSPIGMHPQTDTYPTLPYEYLTPKHYLYDLVYNPTETLFLKKGWEKSCTIQNGLEMLHLQADQAWEIWNT
ncbi:MAG: shikimate dehydrogenase family protein [Flavobacteriales bacterium AspAUS03]